MTTWQRRIIHTNDLIESCIEEVKARIEAILPDDPLMPRLDINDSQVFQAAVKNLRHDMTRISEATWGRYLDFYQTRILDTPTKPKHVHLPEETLDDIQTIGEYMDSLDVTFPRLKKGDTYSYKIITAIALHHASQ